LLKALKGLKGIKKIHFVGIGGAGMSPLARILCELGYEVTGSDREETGIITALRKLGATIWLGGQKGENVRGADAIVVSSAIPHDNPEVLAARDLGITRLHRSDINAALVNEYKGIAVAGAHGKTTTTSMLGVVLEKAGIDPTIIVGGEVPDLGTNAKLGKVGGWLVSEADESDGTFLKLHPHIAVVTNVEDDHMDHYGTMENIIKAFTQFIENTKEADGFAVLCFENKNLREIIQKKIDRGFLSYAIDAPADYQAKNLAHGGKGISFDVYHGEEKLGHVDLNIPGRHNVLDAMACIVTGLSLGVPFEKIAAGLAAFHGAKRRFQTKGKIGGVWVVDDYAHHPTEIAATLKAAKEMKPARLICVFQPHRYSRTQLLHEEFGKAFVSADQLILTDVYGAGEAPIPGISGETIKDEVEKQTGAAVTYIPEKEKLAGRLREIVRPGDLVITMGAGDIFRTGEALVEMLKKEQEEHEQ
jgi:UDP-N-acetylmuramate--alanine ligase